MSPIDVDVSLTARSKTGRYFSAGELKRRVRSLRGDLFRAEDGSYYLRDTLEHRVVVIVFRFDPDDQRAMVVTQTADHYDWSALEHCTGLGD